MITLCVISASIPAKLQPITYDPVNHNYIAIGDKAGNAFSDGKKLK